MSEHDPKHTGDCERDLWAGDCPCQARCVICDQPTTNTQRATIGDKTGPCCEDCAYWCDGNLDES